MNSNNVNGLPALPHLLMPFGMSGAMSAESLRNYASGTQTASRNTLAMPQQGLECPVAHPCLE